VFDPSVSTLASVFQGAQAGLSLTIPTAGPVVLQASLSNVTYGSVTLTSSALMLTLPNPVGSLSGGTSLVKATSSCPGLPANALGVTLTAQVSALVGGSPLVFNGLVSAQFGTAAPQLVLCLSMTGTVNGLFGFPGLSVSNVAGSVTLLATPPFFGGASFTAAITFGSAASVTGAFRYTTNPAQDYFYVNFANGMTLGSLSAAALGTNNLPAWLGSTGVGAGTYFAYSGSPQSVTVNGSAVSLGQGFATAGSITIFGFGPVVFSSTFTVSPFVMSLNLVFPPIRIGLCGLYATSAMTSGFTMVVTTAPFAANGNAFFSAPEFSASVALSATNTGFTFSTVATFLGDIQLSLLVAANNAGAQFVGSFTVANIVANPAVVASIKAWGDSLPTMSTSGELYSGCNELFDNACASWNAFVEGLQNPTVQSLNALIGLNITVTGTLGAKSSSFGLSLELEFDGYQWGPYSLSYTTGKSLASQFSAYVKSVWTDLNENYPAMKCITSPSVSNCMAAVEDVAEDAADDVEDAAEDVYDWF